MKPLMLSGPPEATRSASDPDPEVPAKARRRTFTAKYKLDILKRGRGLYTVGSDRRDSAARRPLLVASEDLETTARSGST